MAHVLGVLACAGNKKSPKNQGLRIMVAWGGIEPPTQGFSILRDFKVDNALGNKSSTNKSFRKLISPSERTDLIAIL